MGGTKPTRYTLKGSLNIASVLTLTGGNEAHLQVTDRL